MHPFLKWFDSGMPATMDRYDQYDGWLENSDVVKRGATFKDFMYWNRNKQSIYGTTDNTGEQQ